MIFLSLILIKKLGFSPNYHINFTKNRAFCLKKVYNEEQISDSTVEIVTDAAFKGKAVKLILSGK